MKTRMFCAALAFSFGCTEGKSSGARHAEVTLGGRKPVAALPAPAVPPPPPVGLHAPDNDPEVVAMAKAALECPRKGDDLFDTDCAAYKTFRENESIKKADATLLNFIEDADQRARYLGAIRLRSGWAENPEPDHVKKRESALRLIRAMEKEKSEPIARMLGSRVGYIEVEPTGTLEDIKALVKDHPVRYAAFDILGSLLMANSDSRPTYEYLVGLTRDPDAGMRSSAVGAFWTGGGTWKTETCAMYKERLSDSDPGVAAKAAQSLGWYSEECAPNWDALILAIDGRIQTKTLGGKSSFATGLERLCEQEKVKPGQKKKAAVLAKKLVAERENEDFLRWGGLEAVQSCDPKGSRAVLAKYTRGKGEDAWLAQRAREMLAEKKK